MPIQKKQEKKLEDIGYKFSHYEKNHQVYKHSVITYPHKGAIYRVSNGSKTKHFDEFFAQIKATVRLSLQSMEVE
tara:strand:- start:1284 stop:1508 length:225 start_codon:yes stop_codon:yes gene_type:complete